MSRIAFSIPGPPKGKARPRAQGRVVYQNGRPIALVHMHPDDASIAVERAILTEFRLRYPRHEPWVGPILLRFTAVFPLLASFTKAQREAAIAGQLYHTAKPDKDNVEKLLVDALNGHAWVDDSQVQGGGIKRYGSPARIDVVLERLAAGGIPAPSDKAAEARLAEHRSGARPLGVKTKRTKSKTKHPPQVERAIAAALAKETPRK